jgi:hypothetical protein
MSPSLPNHAENIKKIPYLQQKLGYFPRTMGCFGGLVSPILAFQA